MRAELEVVGGGRKDWRWEEGVVKEFLVGAVDVSREDGSWSWFHLVYFSLTPVYLQFGIV